MTATPQPGRPTRPHGAMMLFVAFAAVLAASVLNSLAQAWKVDNRRADLAAVPAARRASELSWAGRDAAALRAFRSRLSPEDEFALVFGEDADAVLLRLLAHYYFYPAVEVALERADVVAGFGEAPEPSADVRRDVVVDDAWLGRRTP